MSRFFIGLASFAIIFFLILGCTGAPASDNAGKSETENASIQPQVPSQIPSEPPAAPPEKPGATNDANNLTQIRTGKINLDEIGGEGLTVVSAFKPSTSVSIDGSFTTVVSSIGAQLVMVTDKNNELRATAISLPEDELLVFDAKSTTKASMWIGGSATQEEGAWALAIMETYKCYPDFYAFMKSNLNQKSLSKIANFSNIEYTNLQMQCVNETFELINEKMPN